LLFLAVFVAYRLALKNEKLNIYCYLKFAQANNLIYFSRDPLAKIQEANNIYIPISGLIFNVGFGQKFRDLIGNNDLSIGNYQFLTTNGKTTKVHKWVVASVKLSRNLPHIVLDSKQNNELGISNLPESFKRDQRVDAEPALTDYFTLYAPQGYQIDSLSFVAPDVIAVLRDDFVKFDLEIIDNTLYIYHMGELKNNQIQDVFQKIHNLLSPLETNINNYVDDRSQQGAYINGLNAIAPQGRLLQKSHVKQIMISILFVIIAVIQLCLGGNH
jgi:hypothetical protein